MVFFCLALFAGYASHPILLKVSENFFLHDCILILYRVLHQQIIRQFFKGTP